MNGITGTLAKEQEKKEYGNERESELLKDHISQFFIAVRSLFHMYWERKNRKTASTAINTSLWCKLLHKNSTFTCVLSFFHQAPVVCYL